MNHLYFFILFILIAFSTNSSAQSRLWEPEKYSHNIFFYRGKDLEITKNHRKYIQYDLYKLNLCFGYRWMIKNGWALQPAIGFQQFAIPLLRLAHVSHLNTDTDRILLTDTVSVSKLSGFSASLVVAKNLRWGITLSGGLYGSKYKRALVEKSTTETSVPLQPFGPGVTSSTRSYNNRYTPTPEWVQQEQFGLQLGIEKTIIGPLYIGLSMYQGLRDITPTDKTVKNYPTNCILYFGLQLGVTP